MGVKGPPMPKSPPQKVWPDGRLMDAAPVELSGATNAV